MIDLEKQKEYFKNHIAKFTDYGNIKILDFKAPNISDYRIRFLFEEDYCKLHISGDLGELVATNYNNMTYDNFSDFINNVDYFQDKIDCHSRPIYAYDEDVARKELLQMIEEYGMKDKIMEDAYEFDGYEDVLEKILMEILEDYSEYNDGIGQIGCERLSEYFSDAWEFSDGLGRTSSGILELYLLAFELAQENLKKQEA